MVPKHMSTVIFFVLCVKSGVQGQTAGFQLSHPVPQVPEQYVFPGRIVHKFLPLQYFRHLPLPSINTHSVADQTKVVPTNTGIYTGPSVLFRALGPGEMRPAVGLETKPMQPQTFFTDLNINIPPPVFEDPINLNNKQDLHVTEKLLPWPPLKTHPEVLVMATTPQIEISRSVFDKVKKQVGVAGMSLGIQEQPNIQTPPTLSFEFTTPRPCLFKPYAEDERFFMQFVAPGKWIPRRCALGTVYNPSQCDCSSYAPGDLYNSCKPEINVNFTDGVNDASGNQLPIGSNSVDAEAGHGKFNGYGRLLLWRYINFDFEMSLVMKLKFLPQGNGDKLQSLISNCDWDPTGPSVGILYSSLSSSVIFMIMTDLENGTKHFAIPAKTNTWNDVTFTYDGKFLTGTVNELSERLEVTGAIQVRPSALVVGYCDHFGWYKGLMDDIAVYTCIPDQGL